MIVTTTITHLFNLICNLLTLYSLSLLINMQVEFDWLEMDNRGNQTNHKLEMKHDRIEYKYGVGVAYGSTTAGVIWAECLHGFNSLDKKGNNYF